MPGTPETSGTSGKSGTPVIPGSRGASGAPPEPYGGRLVVLVDRGVASSGETFVQLAGQIRGAVLVGENTAGCVSYGNVEDRPPLPHSRYRLSFGRTRFVPEWVRPTREGVGFFPDFWLDTPDPTAAAAAWLRRESR